MELNQEAKNFVAQYGTKVKSGTERYVLELSSLNEPIHFINPKDAGTKYGDQNLKGDGQDILLLNGLSKEQIEQLDTYLQNKDVSKFGAAEVKELLDFLEKNNFNDRYCSNQTYMQNSLIYVNGHMYRRNNDECKALKLHVGDTYSDGEKTQQANVEGALFVVDSKGGARITNVPKDYTLVNPKEGIPYFSEKKTFEDLQKPTMSLIGAFYEMPADVKEFFADMVAVYEANPTDETAKMLSDKVMSRDSAEDKKKWLKEQVATVSPMVRVAAKKKYLDEMQSVPKGVPASGMVMTGLNVIDRKDKDALMDAQAAARILAEIENPRKMGTFDVKKEFVAKDRDGNLVEAGAFLDKPFATKIQRLEHIGAMLGVYKAYNTDVKSAQTELKAEAVRTLADVSKRLSKTSPDVAKKVAALADTYVKDTPAVEKAFDFDVVAKTLREATGKIDSLALGKDAFTTEESKILDSVVEKRINQVNDSSKEQTKEKKKAVTYSLTGKNKDVSITVSSALIKNQGR